MKNKVIFLLLFLPLFGCRTINDVDLTPPPPPQGIRTVSLDNAIELSWLPSQASDVAGYSVWRSDNPYHGFLLLGTIKESPFVDDRAYNGTTYYYSISAYDYAGNESAMSAENVYDTPRPEGYDVSLNSVGLDPARSGYDFSAFSIERYDDQSADVFFDNVNGRLTLNVWSDSDIQDMGNTESLDEISAAPLSGWSPSKSAEAIGGHTYVVWTWDDHFAKLRVTDAASGAVRFDWSYQTAKGNPELKRTPEPNGLRAPITPPKAGNTY
jgi:hypothetical protein